MKFSRTVWFDFCVILIIAGIGTGRIVSTYRVFNHTNDEPAHIAAGMEWLDTGSYLYEPQHPPLARIATAVGPFIAGVRLSDNQAQILHKMKQGVDIRKVRTGWYDWHPIYRSMWESGFQILDADGAYFRNLSLARRGILPFFILSVIIVWLWALELFGRYPSLIAAFLLSMLPPVLGHSGLATTDAALMSMYLLGMFTFVRWLKAPSLRRSCFMGVTWAFAILTKFSALVFLPVSAVAILVWKAAIDRSDESLTLYQGQPNRRSILAKGLIIAGVIALVTMWGGYRFSLVPYSVDTSEAFSSSDTTQNNVSLSRVTFRISGFPIVPLSEFAIGLRQLKEHIKFGHAAYLMGRYSNHGWWYYFLVVLAIKTPLGFLLITAFGFILLGYRAIRSITWEIFVPCLCAATIFLIGITANINIGIRHILPIYPLLAMIAGYGTVCLWTSDQFQIISRFAVCLLMGWIVMSSVMAHPDYLPYFNEIASSSPERFVVGSDLDWGQDLHRLGVELRNRDVQKVSLECFGNAIHLGKHFGLPLVKPLRRYEPTTGWIAISVRKLKDVRNPPHDGYKWLEAYEPVTTIGKSIKLYYVQDDAASETRSDNIPK